MARWTSRAGCLYTLGGGVSAQKIGDCVWCYEYPRYAPAMVHAAIMPYEGKKLFCQELYVSTRWDGVNR